MFRKIIFSVFFACCFHTTSGQTQHPTHLIVYRNALKCSDYYTAIIALNYLVALETKTGKYRDSLAYVYYSVNNYHQSLYWSDEVIKNQPNYIGMLEIKASSLEQTNQIVKAIEVLEKLVALTESPLHTFKLVELQYQIKRLYECVATTQIAEKLKFSKDMFYRYNISESQVSTTPLLAAFYNFKGLALYELGSKEIAKLAFEKSLSIDSSFYLAKYNLSTVNDDLNKANSQKPEDSKNPQPPHPVIELPKKED